MKCLLFIDACGVIVVARCENPSMKAAQLASLICDDSTVLHKDRFGLLTADIFESEALDELLSPSQHQHHQPLRP